MTTTTTATIVKPKERQFQVVPVPAVFTRGRWECIDYKEGAPGAPKFSLGGDQTIEFENNKNAAAANNTTAIPLATQVGGGGTNFICQPAAQMATGNNGNGGQHCVIGAAQIGGGGAEATTTNQPAAQLGGGGGCLPTNSSVPHFEISPSHSVPTTLGTEFIPPPICSGDSSLVANISAASSTAPTVMAATQSANAMAGCGGAGVPNAVAIDNKIEQAMDLVKTHLTFAVREEVENMRSTIADLETRVNLLESENQILRQFAPADVVGNLPALVQAAQIQQQKVAAAAAQAQANQQQQKIFQTVPSAPVIMDTSTSAPQIVPSTIHHYQQQTSHQLPQQQQSPPQRHHQPQPQHSPTPGAGSDEIL